MSDAKRISEAELDSYQRFSYEHAGAPGSVVRTLVDEVRRLRGLIVKAHASTALNPWGQEELRAEAEAIRKERETG